MKSRILTIVVAYLSLLFHNEVGAFSLIAFAQTGTTALELQAGVQDEHIKVSGDDITVPKWNKIVGTYFGGYAPGDGYLISPSIRRTARLYLIPMDYVMSSYKRLSRVRWYGDRGITLEVGEKLNAFVQSAVNASWFNTVGVWLADKIDPVPPGEIYTIKCSITGKTFTQGAWINSGTLSWTPDLPVGKYAIVGCRLYTVYESLFRFVFLDAANRPGGKSVGEDISTTDPVQLGGGMGIWGTFTQDQEPSIDILNMFNTDITEFYARVDVIKIG